MCIHSTSIQILNEYNWFFFRYPYDVFDRRWFYFDVYNYENNWTTISTPLTVNPDKYYKLPSKVMSTAITPTNTTDPLIYEWTTFLKRKAFYIYLHFAEVQKLEANQSRVFDIYLNGEHYYGPLVPPYLNTTTIYNTSPLSMSTSSIYYNFTFVKHENSTLPPILNAIELYTSIDFLQSETDEEDGTQFFFILTFPARYVPFCLFNFFVLSS